MIKTVWSIYFKCRYIYILLQQHLIKKITIQHSEMTFNDCSFTLKNMNVKKRRFDVRYLGVIATSGLSITIPKYL